jgi:hypothetical protein
MMSLHKPFIIGNKELLLRLAEKYEVVVGEFILIQIFHSKNKSKNKTFFNPDGFSLVPPGTHFPISYCICAMSLDTYNKYEIISDRFSKRFRKKYNREYSFQDFAESVSDEIEIISFPSLYSIN